MLEHLEDPPHCVLAGVCANQGLELICNSTNALSLSISLMQKRRTCHAAKHLGFAHHARPHLLVALSLGPRLSQRSPRPERVPANHSLSN
jgi:hypothetical protein